MLRKLLLPLSAFALVLVIGFASTARADEFDLKTVFTINQPVEIPGHVVLPAGTYVIKRVSWINPVVQILNDSETAVYATVLAVPDVVSTPPDKTTFTFEESQPGSPVALRSWHYPGRITGYEFVDNR